MTTTSSSTDLRPDLKARHRRMWALGDYPAVATEVIADLGPVLVDACAVAAGDRVLDIAAGAGNAAIPAAQTGADVTAADLTPDLLAAGRLAADAAGVSLTWDEVDIEALTYASESFDVVMSCVGAMFAPDHAATARELTRVARPGGRIGLISWTPEGFVGRMFATMKPFVPAPPPGVLPAPLWGDERHVSTLLADRVTDLRLERRTIRVTRFARAQDFLDFFKARYGPTIAAYAGLAAEPDRAAALDADLLALAERHQVAEGVMDLEYLLVTARRR